MQGRLLILLILAVTNADIPHEDPGLLFRAGDGNRDGVMVNRAAHHLVPLGLLWFVPHDAISTFPPTGFH